MKVVLITNTFFETDGSGTAVPKFEGGKYYLVNEDSERQVARRNGELVDAPEGWVPPGSESPAEADGTEAAPAASTEAVEPAAAPAAPPAAPAKNKRAAAAAPSA